MLLAGVNLLHLEGVNLFLQNCVKIAIMEKRKIFPSITTTDGNHLDKLKEVNRLRLEEVCFFPTCLNPKERKNFYPLLEKSRLRKIPLVHLKDDFKLWEIEYYLKNFQTEVFNAHTSLEFPIPQEWLKYKDKIYIENTVSAWDKEELEKFAGVCLDFSHLEDARLLRKEIYEVNIKLLDKHSCGCGHISAVSKNPMYSKEYNINYYSIHYFEALSEFDYLKNYPKKYFPQIIALELENSIKEQLKAKEYIERILDLDKVY